MVAAGAPDSSEHEKTRRARLLSFRVVDVIRHSRACVVEGWVESRPATQPTADPKPALYGNAFKISRDVDGKNAPGTQS
jgi:hypothetical protein